MSTNLAPIPSRLPAAHEAFGQIGAANPLVGTGAGPKTNPIVRYLAALIRYKWLVLFLVICGFGGGYFMSRLLPESFVVSGSLYVADPNFSGNQSAPSYTNEQWKDFINDYQVIEPVVRSRKLFIKGPKGFSGKPLPQGPSGPNAGLFKTFVATDNFQPGNYELQISDDGKRWELKEVDTGAHQNGAVGDSIGGQFGFAWQPYIEQKWYGQTFAFEAKTPREAADALKSDLEIDPRTRFIFLTLTGENSEMTAGTLNDILHEAVSQAILKKRENLTQARVMLETGKEQSAQELHDAERKYTDFQTQNITKPKQTFEVAPGVAGTQTQGYAEFVQRRKELENMQRDRGDIIRALQALRFDSVGVSDRFLAIPTIRENSEIVARLHELDAKKSEWNQLMLTRKPGYVGDSTGSVNNTPRMKADIDKLLNTTIPGLSGPIVDRLDSNIARAESDIAHETVELDSMPTRMITDRSLQRDLVQKEKVNEIMTDRALNASLQEKSAINDLSVNDAAVPPLVPKKNRKMVILALGIALGLGSGLAIVFLLDLMDKRVRYADQITSGLGLTILGVVPEIRRVKGEQTTIEEESQVIEAFRTIRLNLSHAAPEGRLALTISSPAPGEGKSLVASNLALSFAEAGYRTLLIDGDTRRGELHRTFGIDRRPGLIDHLADDHPSNDLLRPTTHALLKLIPSGSRKRNSPELLGSKRMSDLVKNYRDQFDVVIVDSPPLAAGIDPFVLATVTGNLMLVVRAGATQKDLAEAKLQIVDQLPIRLVGAVLNDVHASSTSYKYYSYSAGYAALDEGGEEKQLPAKVVEVKEVK